MALRNGSARTLRIAALVKQIPAVEEMVLGADGRLVREGTELEMSAYCRRAVSKAVELAGAVPGSSVTVVTLGPPSAEDVLREAIAWGLDRDVQISGVLVTDRAFAGSDTIATARALASVLRREGPFDLVLGGRSSLDADTGQVPPQVAELLDLPFATGVKALQLDDDVLTLGCELDDAWLDVEVRLPALLSCAERLCEPTKVPPPGRLAVPAERIRTVGAADLGAGPWGAAGSRTLVGEARQLAVARRHEVDPDAPLGAQVDAVVRRLADWGALAPGVASAPLALPATGGAGPVVAVLAEPDHDALARELCGAAADLAFALAGSTVLLAPHDVPPATAGSWGADRLVRITGAEADEDVATALARWAQSERPWAIVTGSTAFGREVASRAAAAIDAGLTGDAVDLEVVDGRLVAWKPAFGGQLVAAITATSPVQMATVRSGVLPRRQARDHVAEDTTITVEPRGRVTVLDRRREDSLEGLSEAAVVIGIGAGVAPEDLSQLEPLRALLGAEIGCTRKVTDKGWMPHARQIGITGRSISPRLFVAIGASGKFNHMVGVRSAGVVVAINQDPAAPVWEHADTGIVGGWQDAVEHLVDELPRVLTEAAARRTGP
ncbi:MAG: FAD-binding protein [Acidimicrobiales bacterium]